MKIIGLTGGIGSGKSTVSFYLREKGCKIIDADGLARAVTEKGSPALDEIRRALGDGVFSHDGSMDRKAVAELVFGDKEKKAKLEDIVTKRVVRMILDELDALLAAKFRGTVVVDAPLLFEFDLDRAVDESWTVELDREKRIERVCQRDGLSREQVLARMKGQMTDVERRKRADRIIDNSGSLEELYAEVDGLLRALGEDEKGGKGVELLKGKPVAEEIDRATAEMTEELLEKGIVPTLAILRVGENPSDMAYEDSMVRKGRSLAVATEKYIMDEDAAQEDVEAVIRAINSDDKIHGLIMFRPLPKALDEERISNLICPEKDVDCISMEALAKVFAGEEGCFAPCTAQSVMELLRHYRVDLSGKNAVVIGRSLVIGKPAAMLLLGENATVTLCHSKTPKAELRRHCKAADVIVCAAGKAKMLTEDLVTGGKVIVDVGINFTEDGRMCGDVDGEALEGMDVRLTPVPGGVGSVTTSLLMNHVVRAAAAAAAEGRNVSEGE